MERAGYRMNRLGLLVHAGLLAALLFLSGWWFTDLFVAGSATQPVLITVLMVTAGVLMLRLRRPPALMTDALVGLASLGLALLLVGVLNANEPAVEIREGLVDGWVRILTTAIPVPGRMDLLVVPIVVVGICTIVGQLLLLRSRSIWLPAAPVLVSAAVGLAFSSFEPRQPTVLVLVLVLGSGLMALIRAAMPATDASLDERLFGGKVLTAPPVGGALLLLASCGIALVVSPLVLDVEAKESFTLRRYVEADLEDLRMSSAMTRAEELAGESEVLQVKASTAIPAGTRVRLVGLDSFNGLSWTSQELMEPIGSNIPGSEPMGTRLEFAIVTVGLEMPWIPSAGRATHIEEGSEGQSTLVLWSDLSANLATPDLSSSDGISWRVSAVVPAPSQEQLLASRLAFAEPLDLGERAENENVKTLAATAEEIVGPDPGSFVGAARLLAYFRNDEALNLGDPFSLDPEASTSFALGGVISFLDQRVGNSFQFASSYAAMARLAGVPVRVAVGAELSEDLSPGDSISVPGSALAAWPEVNVAGVGWIPLDPTPDAEGESATPAEQELEQALDEAASSVPEDKPPIPDELTSDDRAESDSGGSRSLMVVALVAMAVAGVVGLLVAPVLRVRRRMKRRSGPPGERISGAWAELLDLFAEAGEPRPLAASPTETCRQLAGRLDEHGQSDASELARLFELAVYSPGGPSDVMADRSWNLLGGVRAGLHRSRWETLRASLSTKPLRLTKVGTN